MRLSTHVVVDLPGTIHGHCPRHIRGLTHELLRGNWLCRAIDAGVVGNATANAFECWDVEHIRCVVPSRGQNSVEKSTRELRLRDRVGRPVLDLRACDWRGDQQCSNDQGAATSVGEGRSEE